MVPSMCIILVVHLKVTVISATVVVTSHQVQLMSSVNLTLPKIQFLLVTFQCKILLFLLYVVL